MSIGKGIYDSFNREVESMISESFQVKSTVAENMMGNEDSITITATGNDVDRIKELLQHMGISHNIEAGHEHGEEPCGTCGGIPCQCDELGHESLPIEVELDEADVTVDENDPDYPTNQEYDDDALQYSGGLNGPKHDVAGNGQTTIPVTAVRVKENAERSIFDLYKAIETLSK